MKQLKMLGLAAIAALGLMAFVGASTASGDVFCTVNNTPECPSGKKITELRFSLKGVLFAFQTTAHEELMACTESSVTSTVEKQGEGVEPEGPISSLTWGGCSHTTDTIKNGSFKVETRIIKNEKGEEVHINTVTLSGSEVTVGILGVSCTYGPGASAISLGSLSVGEPALQEVNTTVNKTAGSFLCPSTIIWIAIYQLTNHTGLWVSKK